MKAILLTNNQLVTEEELLTKDKRIEIRFVKDAGILEFLNEVRDMVHKGHLLLTHPLSGSVKPFETPYKSVLIGADNSQNIDFGSLKIIEDSIAIAHNFSKNNKLNLYTKKIHEDLMIIDLELIKSGIESYRR